MVKIQFYPLDLTYKVINSKPVIFLFGKTTDGKKVCITDENFEPYFFVNPKKDSSVAEYEKKIKEISVKENEMTYSVTGTSTEEKKYNGKKSKVIKVKVNVPKAVPRIKEDIEENIEKGCCFEADILFTRRYLIDKNIIPLTLCEADAEPADYRLKIDTFNAKEIKNVSDESIKNPKILAFDIETYSLSKEFAPEKNPILMISFYSQHYKKVITWKRFKTDESYIEFVKSEADLIARFVEVIEEQKPDILTGYFSDGFDFPYIKVRAKKHKIILDMGLDRSELSLGKGRNVSASITGFFHFDVLTFIKNIIRTSLETDSYTLNAVAKEMIGEEKIEVDLDKLSHVWDKKPEELGKFCEYNLQDSVLAYKLCDKLLPNVSELVKIVGLTPDDVIRMGFSQLVEWFLIKRSNDFKELIPNKPAHDEIDERLKASYKGAFVYEPKPGLYKDIGVFDFRSLYPTIIAAHNISPSTLKCDCCKDSSKKAPLEKKNYWFCKKKKGFIPTMIEELITRRMRIKEIISKEGKRNAILDARSDALKTLANSAYGYYAFFGARWYCIECAESTTAWGRFYINKVIDEATKKGFEVLYGDTDSVFLSLKGKEKEDALKFVESINVKLPGLMELELEDFYPAGIFVSAKLSTSGAKKKYALISEKGSIKITGFEAVRRNWSKIAKEVQENVLVKILKENDPEGALKYVKEIIEKLIEHKVPVEKVIISTQLQKEIGSYEAIGPHVAAAQRMINKGIEVGAGSIIKYVIVKGKDKIRDRARLVDEVKQDDYDPEYYINNQVIPAVEGIIEVLGYNAEEFLERKDQSKLDKWI